MKTMRYTRLIVIILLLSFSLIITPQFTNVVSAAFPITLCNFDSSAAGLDDGSEDYITWDSTGTANYFETSTNYDLSASNSFAIKCRDDDPMELGKGYWNLTTDFSYIGQINFSFVCDYASMNEWWTMKFYDSDDNNVINLKFYYAANFKLQSYDNSISNYVTIMSSLGDCTRYYLLINHDTNNIFDFTVLDSTFAEIGWLNDTAGSYAGDWTNFSYIYFNSFVQPGPPGATYGLYIDNFIIDTTWSGTGTPPAGYLSVNCFNEVTGANITDFNMVAVNQLGHTFFDYNLNNTYVVAGGVLPQGETTITISALNYYPRSYAVDIESGYFIIDGVTYTTATIDAYLPKINLSRLYYIQVVDESLYPVEDARVLIKGLCGNTTYETVSDTLTDGYGYVNTYLCSGRNYQVTINKTGYTTKTEAWIPDPTYYGAAYPKVFKITHNYSEITLTFGDAYNFYATMHTNNTINIVCEELIPSTINAQLYIYETYNSTITLKNSHSYTTPLNFSIWEPGINTSRMYVIILHTNHSLIGYSIKTLYIFPITNNGTKINGTWLEKKITDRFGNWNLGYVNTGLLFIPAICLIVLFGAAHQSGFGLFLSGCYLGGVLKFVQFDLGTAAKMIMLSGLFILMGILLIISKRSGWYE